MDIQASPVVKGIFWLRAIPALARGEPFRPQGPRGIVAETLAWAGACWPRSRTGRS